MIPFHEIQKQLSNDPEILDHFIITEQNVIKEIRNHVIIVNETNNIEINQEEAEVIAKEYYDSNKEEFKYAIGRYFDYIVDSDKWMHNIDFEESDLLKRI
jgi:hypothetical protein